MPRARAASNASTTSSAHEPEQELGSMYDYLAKIVLIGPSGTGKSCLLHRFVKSEWRVLSSQTIGVEFASKIVRVGSGMRRKRIKLQLWDTAGTERFRSVSRSYYRGAAGALLVYDISSISSFASLSTFVNDARALASPNIVFVLVGNKADLAHGDSSHASSSLVDTSVPPSFASEAHFPTPAPGTAAAARRGGGLGAQNTFSTASEGRQVTSEEVSQWAVDQSIPLSVEASAFSGENVDEIFTRLAQMILTKIELGEIDPDDPQSGIQYGETSGWTGHGTVNNGDNASIRSGLTMDDSGGFFGGSTWRRRKGRSRGSSIGWVGGMREWDDVFRLEGSARRRRCC